MTLLSRCIALLMLLTASVAWAEGRSNWVLFAPKGPGFRVELPGQPTVKNADVKTTHGPAKATFFYFKGENGLEGMMEVRDYDKGKIKDARGFLDEERNYHEARRKFRSESRFSFSGNPAQKFVMDTVDGRIATVEQVIIDDRFISVVCFVPMSQGRSADVERIITSFALVKS